MAAAAAAASCAPMGAAPGAERTWVEVTRTWSEFAFGLGLGFRVRARGRPGASPNPNPNPNHVVVTRTEGPASAASSGTSGPKRRLAWLACASARSPCASAAPLATERKSVAVEAAAEAAEAVGLRGSVLASPERATCGARGAGARAERKLTPRLARLMLSSPTREHTSCSRVLAESVGEARLPAYLDSRCRRARTLVGATWQSAWLGLGLGLG